MFFIRNPNQARSLTVVAGEELLNGALVKLVQGEAIGEPPKVVLADEADFDDDEVIKGVVQYVPDNDLAVDQIINPGTQALTLNTGADNTVVIPEGAQCAFWYDKPICGYHEALVDSSLDVSTVREPALVTFDSGNDNKLALFDTGGTPDPARDVVFGYVYRNDYPEITVVLDRI